MTGRQAVRRAVKADIKASLSVVDQVVDLLFIGDLRDKAAPDKLFVNLHQSVSFFILFPRNTDKFLMTGMRGTAHPVREAPRLPQAVYR